MQLNIGLMFFCNILDHVSGSEEEERLMTDLFRRYNSLIQPIRNISDLPLLVKMTVQLVYIINVVSSFAQFPQILFLDLFAFFLFFFANLRSLNFVTFSFLPDFQL